jgi:hypothetical protein
MTSLLDTEIRWMRQGRYDLIETEEKKVNDTRRPIGKKLQNACARVQCAGNRKARYKTTASSLWGRCLPRS